MTTDCISQVPLEFYDNLKPVMVRFDQAYAAVARPYTIVRIMSSSFV
ncbi:MAG: hypothetical protein OJF50_005750 [Nitrospira sp.]|nr:hypothetical protein [Nitrospira sp.]